MVQALPPILIGHVLDDPEQLRDLVERHSPYLPVQRYFVSDAEYRASSGRGRNIVAPNFRGDWAYDVPLVQGAEIFLGHQGFARAASMMFGTDLVRPQIVYTNLTWQLPFNQGGGHTDIPAFRGIDRTRYPIWLLGVMGHSGLFEEERIRIATAVAWFYRGSDGGFTYWPDGPEAAPRVHEGDIFNTAIVGDNDRMFHRVRPVGRRENGVLQGMTLDTRLEHVGSDDWIVAEGDETRASLVWDDLRISVSWKAQVFRDERERRLCDDHSEDLEIGQVFERLYADLEARRIPVERPSDPVHEPQLVEVLSAAYVREPTVFD
jgi:hypothetical protein